MKINKSPGSDGLTVEFFFFFMTILVFCTCQLHRNIIMSHIPQVKCVLICKLDTGCRFDKNLILNDIELLCPLFFKFKFALLKIF